MAVGQPMPLDVVLGQNRATGTMQRSERPEQYMAQRGDSAWCPHMSGQVRIPSPTPHRAMSGITAINVTMCQDRLQQNPKKQNNQPADKAINKKQFLIASGSCLPRAQFRQRDLPMSQFIKCCGSLSDNQFTYTEERLLLQLLCCLHFRSELKPTDC